MPKGLTLFERAAKRGKASLGLDGEPIGCIVKIYGDAFRPEYCGKPKSPQRCRDCWARTYREVKRSKRSFTAEDISEPALIASRYTLGDLIVPNKKRNTS